MSIRERILLKIKKSERNILNVLKNNRTQIFLDFFRKHSAVLVVVLITVLVTAGNARSEGNKKGFLYGFFKETENNQAKIQKRIEGEKVKQNQSQNLAVASLEVAGGINTEKEGQEAIMLNEKQLAENQMQYQVLTATAPDTKALLSSGSDVAVYEVKPGDSVGSIAKSFKVTVNTILWANDISNPNEIMPGDKIFILPVTGVKHKVKKGDTIEKIAKKYKVKKEEIIAFNDLLADGSLTKGEEIIIPGGVIKEKAKTTTPNSLLPKHNYYSSSVVNNGLAKRKPSIIDRNPRGGHRFPWGQCTWYVASKKYVPWGGNAGTWLYHARAYGAKTGKTPKKGAIIVTSESWYGHVGIVTSVKGNNITIREMNYKGFGKVSSRTISAKSRRIKGYIY